MAQARVADFAAFTATLIRRYGREGSFWSDHPGLPYEPVTRIELWNEPNWTGFWCPGPDPEAFAPLLAASARAVATVDSELDVVLGGLVLIKEDLYFTDGKLRGIEPGKFLARMVAKEPSLPELIDSVGIHLYDPEADINISLLGWFRARLDAADLGSASLLVTEFGWRTAGGAGAVSEEQRVESYLELVDQLPRTNCGIEGIAAHDWATEESDPLNAHQWFGIANLESAELYPSGHAYREKIGLFEGRGPAAPPRETITVCDRPLPDQDGDGTVDEEDDYPLDPEQQTGSGEEPPPTDAEPKPVRTFPARVDDEYFGVSDAWMPQDALERQKHYAAIAAAGIGRIRETLEWRDIEAAPGTTGPRFRWSDSDRRFFSLAKREIRIVPTTINRRADLPSDPAAVDQAYAEFMSELAKRYGSDGSFWAENRHLDSALAPREFEVWSAANGSGGAWDGSPSAAEYAATYAHTRAALHEVDPRARAIASLADGGPGGTAASYIRGMVAADPSLSGALDGVYVMGGSARSSANLEQLVASVRGALNATGNPTARLYVGFGAPVEGSGSMTPAERATFFEEAASRLPRVDCGVDGIYANAWLTAELDLANPFDWYGIASHADGSLSPAGLAYQEISHRFLGYSENAAPRAALHPCMRDPLDRDGDGAADPVDEAPLDPSLSAPTAPPPEAPSFVDAPPPWSNTSSPSFGYRAPGAESYHCRLDGGPYEPCADTRVLAGLSQGEHSFTVRAVDGLGMLGATSTHRWQIDTRPPETTIVAGPSGTILKDQATFSLASDEQGARFICHLDAGNRWCDPEISFEMIADGPHAFRAAAVDRAGNVDSTSAVARFEVRTTPALPSITSVIDSTSQVPSFHFSGRYAVSFECRFDQEAFRPCSNAESHTPASPLRDGFHRFAVRGIGGTGKPGEAATTSVTVDDVTAPETTIRSAPSGTLLSDTAVIELESADPHVTFYCQLDDAKWAPCGGRATFSGLSEGPHRIRAAAFDSGGNLDPSPAVVEFIVHLTPARPLISSGPDAGSTSGPLPHFEFGVAGATKVECRFDQAAYEPCATSGSHVPAEQLADGAHVFEVRGIGGTGIVGSSTTRSFSVDTEPPSIRIATRTEKGATGIVRVRLKVKDQSNLDVLRRRVDGGKWKSSRPRFRIRLQPGRHVLVVKATDEWGNRARTAKRLRIRG